MTPKDQQRPAPERPDTREGGLPPERPNWSYVTVTSFSRGQWPLVSVLHRQDHPTREGEDHRWRPVPPSGRWFTWPDLFAQGYVNPLYSQAELTCAVAAAVGGSGQTHGGQATPSHPQPGVTTRAPPLPAAATKRLRRSDRRLLAAIQSGTVHRHSGRLAEPMPAGGSPGTIGGLRRWLAALRPTRRRRRALARLVDAGLLTVAERGGHATAPPGNETPYALTAAGEFAATWNRPTHTHPATAASIPAAGHHTMQPKRFQPHLLMPKPVHRPATSTTRPPARPRPPPCTEAGVAAFARIRPAAPRVAAQSPRHLTTPEARYPQCIR